MAVAYKDLGEKWQERTFAWPAEREKLTAWIEIHSDANVFVNPMLRKSMRRAKADGKVFRWLWADVDMDKVPEAKRPLVRKRIETLGTMLVSSGSGENRHVYAKLAEETDYETWRKLNQGLRDYLYADNKHTDNALLRMPGTRNFKPGNDGSPVEIVGGHNKAIKAETLLGWKVWQAVVVAADIESDGEWTKVDISKVLVGSVKSLVGMTVQRAKDRYGSRYKAVSAVTEALVKRGLSDDQVHTCMDLFEPGHDKVGEEGGYDLHKDVGKAIIRTRDAWKKEVVDTGVGGSKDGADEETGGGDADPDDEFPEASDEEQQIELDRIYKEDLDKLVRSKRLARDAKRIDNAGTYRSPFTDILPNGDRMPSDIDGDLDYWESKPRKPKPYLFDKMAQDKHNVILTAKFKTGKTELLTANVIRSAVTGEDLLGTFPTRSYEIWGGSPGRDWDECADHEKWKVGFWSCEMDIEQLTHECILPAEFPDWCKKRLRIMNLRGRSLSIMVDEGRDEAVAWLIKHGVKMLVIDSLARIARMSGISENDNDEMGALLHRIDEIKAEAGVDVCFIVGHTGRAEMAEGAERVRGATAIDDWVDARWTMTRDPDNGTVKGTRYLSVEGRGVELITTSLRYDPVTKRSVLGIGGKQEARQDMGVEMVVRIVSENPGLYSNNKLRKRIMEDLGEKGMGKGEIVKEWITEAEECERVHTKPGPRNAKMYFPMEEKSKSGATIHVVDMRNVPSGPRRRSNA